MLLCAQKRCAHWPRKTEVLRDVYSQPDAPDPVLDEATVLSLVRRHVPAAQRVAAVDESGGEARAYAVDDAVILKTQRPHRLRPRTSLEKEALILQHLAAHHVGDPLPVPCIYGYGKESTPYGLVEYVCMSRVAGVAAVDVQLDGPQRPAVLRELGGVLARVHAVPQGPLVESGLVPGDRSAADLARRVESQLITLVETLDGRAEPWPGRRTLRDVASAVGRAFVPTSTRVTLHSNPSAVHTFVHPQPLAFSGLIDFGDAFVSHPAFDLVRWPRREDRDDLLEGYRSRAVNGIVDDSFVATWRVVCILADLQAAARSPARAAESASRVDAMLERLR